MPDFKSHIDSRIRAASWRVLELITLRRQGQYLTTTLAVLAIAEMGQANLPAALAGIGSSIGIEALGSLLDKLSQKPEATLDETVILQTVTQAIEESKLGKLLQENAAAAKAIQELPGWQALMHKLIEDNQAAAQEILQNQSTFSGKLDGIAASLAQVATKSQSEEIEKLLLAILDHLTQPSSPAVAQNHKPTYNPFGLTGCVKDPNFYLVREPLTETIFNELAKGVSLSLVGASQTGKSSLLWHIVQQAPARLDRPTSDFVYVDMQLIHTENDFYACICDELGIPLNRGYLLGRSLKGRKVFLCLDEIEKMTWDGFTLNVRTDLRGLADGIEAPLTLLIASRSPLNQLFPDSATVTSPLGNLCQQIQMPPLTLAEIRRLNTQYLRDTHSIFSDQALEQIWQQTQGHPFAVQVALKSYLNVIIGQ